MQIPIEQINEVLERNCKEWKGYNFDKIPHLHRIEVNLEKVGVWSGLTRISSDIKSMTSLIIFNIG